MSLLHSMWSLDDMAYEGIEEFFSLDSTVQRESRA